MIWPLFACNLSSSSLPLFLPFLQMYQPADYSSNTGIFPPQGLCSSHSLCLACPPCCLLGAPLTSSGLCSWRPAGPQATEYATCPPTHLPPPRTCSSQHPVLSLLFRGAHHLLTCQRTCCIYHLSSVSLQGCQQHKGRDLSVVSKHSGKGLAHRRCTDE